MIACSRAGEDRVRPSGSVYRQQLDSKLAEVLVVGMDAFESAARTQGSEVGVHEMNDSTPSSFSPACGLGTS